MADGAPAPAGSAARPPGAGMLAAVPAWGWASGVRTALVAGLLLASATGSAAAAREPLVIRGGDHADPPTGPPPAPPAGPSVRAVPSTADPGFDGAWCGTPRSTDDSASQV